MRIRRVVDPQELPWKMPWPHIGVLLLGADRIGWGPGTTAWWLLLWLCATVVILWVIDAISSVPTSVLYEQEYWDE